MEGHGQKLSRKQDALIAALLTERTYEDAAARAGVGLTTLYRWLKLSEFKTAFAEARRQIVERTVNRLASISATAVLVLEKNLLQGKPGEQTRTAAVALANLFKGLDVLARNGAPAADPLLDLLYHRLPAQANGANGAGGQR